jgi:hypothetical protein
LRLRDIPETIGWHSAYVFSCHLPVDSAVFRDKYPEYAVYTTPIQTAAMLADIIDAIQWLKYDFDIAHSEDAHLIPKPKPFPTPWAKERAQESMQTIGRGAIPISEFDAWYYGED